MPGRLAAALCITAIGLSACGATSAAPVPEGCLQQGALATALRGAPAAVRLSDGTRLSRCVRLATSDSDLQTLGVALTAEAERLADRALEGETASAVALGYLIGAADRGAAKTAGVSTELVFRLRAAGRRAQGARPEIDAALERGLAAGAARG